MILNTVTWGNGSGGDDIYKIICEQTSSWNSAIFGATIDASQLREGIFAHLDYVGAVVGSKSLTFPNLISIPPDMFAHTVFPHGNTNMFPAATAIGSGAFMDSPAGGISIASQLGSVQTIGKLAFAAVVYANGTSSYRVAVSFPECINIDPYAFVCAIDSTSSSAYNWRWTPVKFGYRQLASNTSIYLPKVQTIADRAFYFCTNYNGNISFPECTTIGAQAFASGSVSALSLPKLQTIGTSAFDNNKLLSTVYAPLLTSIPSYAFAGCNSLATISFSACTRIGSYAFMNCSSLTTVIFPACQIIYQSAFASCSSLTTVSFPACTNIGSNAFRQCSYLDAAYFYWTGTNTSIYSSAFYSCWRLKSLYLLGSKVKPLQNTNVFTSTPISTYTTQLGTNGSIFVPASLLAQYKAAANWQAYSARFVGLTDAQVSAILSQMGL